MWQPQIDPAVRPLYRSIAESLSEDIASGQLQPGEQLPPVRTLADTLNVTPGTVHRAYSHAESRGLIERRVGRGSFVRGDDSSRHLPSMLPAHYTDRHSLAMNYPSPLDLEREFDRALESIRRDGLINMLLNYEASRGHRHHRHAMATWMNARGARCEGESLVLTCGAQQAVATALTALARPGETVLCEQFSYSGLKSVARLHGVKLEGLAMDVEGLMPEALEAACQQRLGRLLFCMPTAQNPTTRTQSAARREAIAEIARRHRLIVIEDDLYLPPTDDTPAPLQALIPERTVYLSSMSKCVAPGLRVGAVHAPESLLPDLIAAAQAFVWMASPLTAEVAARWIDSGEAAAIQSRRAAQNDARLLVARDALRGLRFEYASHNTHLWLRAPNGWGAEEFARALSDRGVTVTPPGYFAVGAHSDDRVRLSVGQPPSEADLRTALDAVAALNGGRPVRMDFCI